MVGFIKNRAALRQLLSLFFILFFLIKYFPIARNAGCCENSHYSIPAWNRPAGTEPLLPDRSRRMWSHTLAGFDGDTPNR